MQWHGQKYVSTLTSLNGQLPVKLQWRYDEAGLAQRAPVVQHPQRPDARPQRQGEGWPVVGDLSGRIHEDVVGGRDDVGGVNPHDGGRQVALAATPALHSHRLVLRSQQTTPVPEETLLWIPV